MHTSSRDGERAIAFTETGVAVTHSRLPLLGVGY
jgi:hypothetical protein